MYNTTMRCDAPCSPPVQHGDSQREVAEASDLLGGALSSLNDAIRELDTRLTPVAVQVPCDPCDTKDQESRFSCSFAKTLDQYIQRVNSMYAFVTDLERRVQL